MGLQRTDLLNSFWICIGKKNAMKDHLKVLRKQVRQVVEKIQLLFLATPLPFIPEIVPFECHILGVGSIKGANKMYYFRK